jgi:hypothetical protein
MRCEIKVSNLDPDSSEETIHSIMTEIEEASLKGGELVEKTKVVLGK